MAKEFNRSEANDDSPPLTQLELLEALLAPDGATYPWNPTDPESEAYFVEQEQKFMLEDWSEAEIAARTQTFFSQIEQIWSDIAPEAETKTATDINDLQASLQQRFAAYVPSALIQAIAQKASQVLSTQKSMAEQLMQCVQELLPNWAEDDLLVLARPFAYSMRSTDAAVIESMLSNLGCQDWTALAEIEQARASLAIAQYALTQLQNSG